MRVKDDSESNIPSIARMSPEMLAAFEPKRHRGRPRINRIREPKKPRGRPQQKYYCGITAEEYCEALKRFVAKHIVNATGRYPHIETKRLERLALANLKKAHGKSIPCCDRSFQRAVQRVKIKRHK